MSRAREELLVDILEPYYLPPCLSAYLPYEKT